MRSFPAAARCRVPSIIAAAALSGLSTAAHAQWTVTNLNPPGSIQAYAFAAGGGQARAGLWSGTAGSWVDLAAFLPTGFTDTYATGISSDGANIFILGYGTNATGIQALLWTQPVPSPGAVALLGLGGLLATRRRR